MLCSRDEWFLTDHEGGHIKSDSDRGLRTLKSPYSLMFQVSLPPVGLHSSMQID